MYCRYCGQSLNFPTTQVERSRRLMNRLPAMPPKHVCKFEYNYSNSCLTFASKKQKAQSKLNKKITWGTITEHYYVR